VGKLVASRGPERPAELPGGVIVDYAPARYQRVSFLGSAHWLAGWRADGIFDVWDVSSKQRIREVRAEAVDWREGPLFLKDGRYYLVGSKDSIQLCEVATGGSCFVRSVINEIRESGGNNESEQPMISAIQPSPACRSVAIALTAGRPLMLCSLGPPKKVGDQREAFKAQDATRCWEQLAGNDSATAYGAMWNLIQSGDVGVEFLRVRLSPVTARAEDDAGIKRLIADLRSPEFRVREEATAALVQRGPVALVYLEKALRETDDAEVRTRQKAIAQSVAESQQKPNGVTKRQIRAVTALERIGSRNARAHFTDLSRGAAAARLTKEAQAALVRLELLGDEGPSK
jgi:hypothetical protein